MCKGLNNMVKCFTISEHLKQKPTQQTIAAETIDSSEDDTDDTDDGESLQDEDASLLDNLNDILDHPVEEGVVLPSHMQCCSHTLKLAATTDAEVALSDPVYKKIY